MTTDSNPLRLLAFLLPVAAIVTGCGSSSSGGGGSTGNGVSTQPPASSATTSPSPSTGSDDGDNNDGDADATDASGPCPKAKPGHPLPADIPHPKGGKIYVYSAQGKTRVWFISIPGDAGDLSRLRDKYDQRLKSRGYEIEGTDAEKGHEAESEFRGKAHEGSTNFRALCSGRDVFRLKLER